MSNNRKKKRRKLSAGTVCMLALLAVVTCGSALVISRLSTGASVDLSKLKMSVLNIQNDPAREAAATAEEEPGTAEPKAEKAIQEIPPARKETPVPQENRESFTLTVGGSISLTGEVRKNSRSTDEKVADYTDIMMLLAPEINSDESIVFLENILSDRHKVSDITAPAEAAILLREAGFNIAACAFSQAYAHGEDGVEATMETLDGAGISTLGIHHAEDSGNPETRTVNGIKTAFLQYTTGVPAKTRKNMTKDGTSHMVAEADLSLISQEIRSVREQGAEAVIILLNWGKTGSNPDKAQKDLANGIAQAGADLIIGNGSHVPQPAEYLTGLNGRSVLCVWSLGSLLNGDRSNIKRLSGYLLHVTVQRNGKGGVDILNPEYTPVYTWKYKQDGRIYYRCIAAGTDEPDGMDKEQRSNLSRAAETVENVLKDSPLTERKQNDAE